MSDPIQDLRNALASNTRDDVERAIVAAIFDLDERLTDLKDGTVTIHPERDR